jgi:hypothetical protein
VATTRQARAAMLVERSEAMNTGSRAAVLRRREQTSVSSASDDKVGGLQSATRAERSEATNTERDIC